MPEAVTAALTSGLYALARRGRARAGGLLSGLAVLGSLDGRRQVILLVLVAVGAQIARNWLMLQSTGIPVSLLDSIAVLIAIVTLTQLPVGPSVGAAATVADGVDAAACRPIGSYGPAASSSTCGRADGATKRSAATRTSASAAARLGCTTSRRGRRSCAGWCRRRRRARRRRRRRAWCGRSLRRLELV